MSEQQNQEPIVSELASDSEVAELVEMFVSELPKRVAAIKGMLDTNNLAQLTVLSHQLKGSAGSYGFPTIGVAAGGIEKASRRRDDLDAIRAEIDKLADLCNRARATTDEDEAGG